MRKIIGYSDINSSTEEWPIDETKWAILAQEVEEFRANSSTTYLHGEFEETLVQYVQRNTNLDPQLCMWVEEMEE